ncbi:MAG: hypothetical protein OXB92_10980, partial [Acidimicrobiaceae bacterium]|nr:hypothetical protein [Acidimicrobiaceae bacterium]
RLDADKSENGPQAKRTRARTARKRSGQERERPASEADKSGNGRLDAANLPAVPMRSRRPTQRADRL